MLEGVLVGIFLSLLTALIVYLHHIYTFWTRRGIKQVTPIPFFGSFLPVVLGYQNHGDVYKKIYSMYPDSDAVGYYQFLTPKLMIRNLELVKRVLISDFSCFRNNEIYTNSNVDPLLQLNPFLSRDEQWKPARTAFIAGVTAKKVRSFLPLMKQALNHLDSYLDKNLEKPLEAKDLSKNFFVTLVSNTVYGVNDNCFTTKNTTFRYMFDLLSKGNWQSYTNVMVIFFLQSIKTWLGYSFIPQPMQKYAASVMRQVTEARVKADVRRNDYVQYYLDRDNTVEEKVFELSNHAISFFIAGMETSSLTGANAMYELAFHQDIQEKLYEELKDAYGDATELDSNTLLTLPYLNQVFEETGRKYHVVFSLPKTCTKYISLEIDGTDVDIFPGQVVVVPCMDIQKDPKYYPDPEVFDPERFTEENKRDRPELTYLLFSEGPRICAGIHFALLQVKMFLAHLVYNYKIVPGSNTFVDTVFEKHAYFVSPIHKQIIKLERRNK